MGNSERASYTAKFTDGPLEGKTMRVNFLSSGDPQPQLEIPAETSTADGKRYLYARGTEFEYDGGDPSSERPSAVDYRYLHAVLS